MSIRALSVRQAAGYTTRKETFEDREYLVVPVVGLVETVVHASNSEFPELVTAAEFSKVPMGWNGRPVFHGHPAVDGVYVSGNSPEMLEEKQIGLVFNTRVENSKLLMEAWIDIEKAKGVAPELLERISEGDEAIQISVGLTVAVADESGTYDGKKYQGVWTEIVPDHLALLPADEIGACSVDAGCGVRAATQGGTMSEPKTGGLVARLMARVTEALRVSQSAEDMSANDVRQKLGEALRALDPRVYYCDDFYPEKGEVIYSVYGDSNYKTYRRNYTLSTDGKVTITGDPVEVQAVLSYEPVGGTPAAAITAATAAEPAETITAPAAPCSCQKNAAALTTATSHEEKNMTRDEMLAKLAGATDAQIADALKVFETPAAAPAAAAEVVAETVTAAAAKAPTFDELLASASPETREAFQVGQRTLAANKQRAIKALKDSGRCKFSDERLAKMSQEELDELVALAGVPADESEMSFALSGAGRVASAGDETVPAAPDQGAMLRASRSFKDQPAAK